MPSRGGTRQRKRIKNAFDIGSQENTSTNMNSSNRATSANVRDLDDTTPENMHKTLSSVHRRGKSLRRKVA